MEPPNTQTASPPTPQVESGYQDDDVFARVPRQARQSSLGFLAIFCGAWASMAAVGVGVQTGLTLTAWKASLAFFLGYLVTMVIAMLTAEIGRRRRFSTAVLCMAPFSRHGAAVPGLLIFLTGAISVGIQVDILVRLFMAMAGMTVDEGGFSLLRGLSSAVFCAIMMYTSYKGIRYIKVLSWIAIPLFFLVLLVGMVTVTRQHPGGFVGIMTGDANDTTFWAVTATGLSLYAGFAALMADIARFARSRRGIMLALVVGFVVSTFVPVAGIYIGAASGGAAYWAAFTQFGLALALFAGAGFFLAQWTTNDNNAFQAGLGFSTFLRSLPSRSQARQWNRRRATLGVAIISVILAFSGAGSVGFIAGFVSYLGATFIPLAGVLIAHFYIVERGGRTVSTRGLAGFVALVVTAVVTILDVIAVPVLVPLLGSILLYCVVYYAVERPLFGERTYDRDRMMDISAS